MLVQALAKYADDYLKEQLEDVAWEMKAVPWLLEISTAGVFQSAVQRMTSVPRGKQLVQVAQELAMPRSPVNRNSGHHPLLTADDIAYVLGAGPWTPETPTDREKAEKHHAAFVALLERAAAMTKDAGLQSCMRFYRNPIEVERARAAFSGVNPGTTVALSVGGPLVQTPAVRAYWRQHYQTAFAERMGGVTGECLVSGAAGSLAPTHEKIKGASSLGGQASGVSLMSFDKEAFRSYGWEQNQNSPVSPDRAMAYVLALNDLLRIDNGKRRDIGGVGFLFWLREPGGFDPFKTLDPQDTATLDAMLKLDPNVDLDSNQFHLAGVSGNGGRLRVRLWVVDSLPRIRTNLRHWHEQLRVAYPWDDPGPVRLRQLLKAIHNEGTGKVERKPPARLPIALLRRAVEGRSQPLGYAILSAALARLRHPRESPGPKSQKADKDSSTRHDARSLQRLRVPMGLLRLCINDIHHMKGEQEMSEGLDDACNIPAYVCGRLMAEFEALQYSSSDGGVNSSVLDRYFSLACTYPAAAFPKMEDLAKKHMRKLRRDKPGAATNIDKRITELYAKLQPATGGFPAKLSLEGQGLFALGYYHQKAWSVARATASKQSREFQPNENSTTQEG